MSRYVRDTIMPHYRQCRTLEGSRPAIARNRELLSKRLQRYVYPPSRHLRAELNFNESVAETATRRRYFGVFSVKD